MNIKPTTTMSIEELSLELTAAFTEDSDLAAQIEEEISCRTINNNNYEKDNFNIIDDYFNSL